MSLHREITGISTDFELRLSYVYKRKILRQMLKME